MFFKFYSLSLFFNLCIFLSVFFISVFIDKFLKYKELLSGDVIEMAFSHQDVQGQGSMMIQSQRANINDIQSLD